VALALVYQQIAQTVCVLLCPMQRVTEVNLELGAGIWEKLIDSAETHWGGKGSSLPAQLKCEGQIKLELTPFSVSVWSKTGLPQNQPPQNG